jgi:hypothetical protein
MGDPPFISVGTAVSAKFRGAFCEAKVQEVVRNIKYQVAFKQSGRRHSNVISHDQIKTGQLCVGATVEVKMNEQQDPVEAIITKIQDCSRYTVIFDDGDIVTLGRSGLFLKTIIHSNENQPISDTRLRVRRRKHYSEDVDEEDLIQDAPSKPENFKKKLKIVLTDCLPKLENSIPENETLAPHLSSKPVEEKSEEPTTSRGKKLDEPIEEQKSTKRGGKKELEVPEKVEATKGRKRGAHQNESKDEMPSPPKWGRRGKLVEEALHTSTPVLAKTTKLAATEKSPNPEPHDPLVKEREVTTDGSSLFWILRYSKSSITVCGCVLVSLVCQLD